MAWGVVSLGLWLLYSGRLARLNLGPLTEWADKYWLFWLMFAVANMRLGWLLMRLEPAAAWLAIVSAGWTLLLGFTDYALAGVGGAVAHFVLPPFTIAVVLIHLKDFFEVPARPWRR